MGLLRCSIILRIISLLAMTVKNLNSIIMLKKKLRIRKQKDFDNIFSKGSYFSEKFLGLKVVENKLEISRFGFIVSNKISKKAVERNRIKRLLREVIRLKQDKIKPGFDAIFIFRGKEIKKSFKDVDAVVENLLKRSGLLVKNTKETNVYTK